MAPDQIILGSCGRVYSCTSVLKYNVHHHLFDLIFINALVWSIYHFIFILSLKPPKPSAFACKTRRQRVHRDRPQCANHTLATKRPRSIHIHRIIVGQGPSLFEFLRSRPEDLYKSRDKRCVNQCRHIPNPIEAGMHPHR